MSKKSKTTKKLWIVFIIVLGATLVAEHWVQPYAKFGIDGLPYFKAWFGFLACAVIVFVSKFLGFFLRRKEGYYKEVVNND